MTYGAYLKASGLPPVPVPPFAAADDRQARAIVCEVAARASRLAGVAYAVTVWESRKGQARTLEA